MNNQIYLYDFYAVIISDSLNTDSHSHLAHQITFSLNDYPFNVKIGESIIESKVLFIPSGEQHEFLEGDNQFLSILIDNEFEMDKFNLKTKISSLDNFPKELKDIESLLEYLGFTKKRNIDSRISKLLETIENTELLENIRLSEMAKSLSLSESRLLHLFKEQVGVPFRKYILWKKLKRAISLFADSKNKSLTEIALNAGFSDSAHLSKVIKASFGLSPSEILKNSQFVKDPE